MTDGKGEQEPTMEEILASIRRIISEDESEESADKEAQTQEPEKTEAEPEPEPAEDVLELTERVEEESVAELSDEEETALEMVEEEAQPEPEPEPEPEPVFEPSAEEEESFVSESAAMLTSAAFAELASTLNSTRSEGRTLEDIVKELLRPMMKAWLDENLPPLVERIVREEVERLSRRR